MKVFFLINLSRRTAPVPPAQMDAFRAAFDRAGAEAEIAPCHGVDRVPGLVQHAREAGFDTLFVGGGDGTVNLLLNLTHGTDLTLGVVPMGTVNAFARSFATPPRPEEAVGALLRATATRIDVGRVNGRLFLCFASVGYDAAVVHDVALGEAKRRLGRMAFAWCAVRGAMRPGRLAPFAVCGEGLQPDTGHSLVLANVCNYAGADLFPGARPDSGTMEMVLFRGAGALPVWRWGVGALARHDAGPTREVTQLAVRSERPLFVQLDGEPVTLDDPCHLEFEVLPGAARVLLPRLPEKK